MPTLGVYSCPYPISGAIDGARTRDLWLGKPKLYQLSYYRIDFVGAKVRISEHNTK